MNIVLLGYMASGKSIVGQKLAQILDWQFIDLDKVIEEKEDLSVQDIFKTKGEIFFRKVESKCLSDVLVNSDKSVIALGGGTPCYGNNINLISRNQNTTSIYLSVAVAELVNRLFEDKAKRPLVAHLSNRNDMTEFVGKHLFERFSYYNQADIVVNANSDIDSVVKTILLELF
ncbi:shikimate kinase [Hanstruepera marina]|uniref:shikimate kinase n=1 Tax=Hanstruepera marina TaxID=2873265 RepID=UPI001CA7841E|nr:shikimate kinase [Hanstruepera marina]